LGNTFAIMECIVKVK